MKLTRLDRSAGRTGKVRSQKSRGYGFQTYGLQVACPGKNTVQRQQSDRKNFFLEGQAFWSPQAFRGLDEAHLCSDSNELYSSLSI